MTVTLDDLALFADLFYGRLNFHSIFPPFFLSLPHLSGSAGSRRRRKRKPHVWAGRADTKLSAGKACPGVPGIGRDGKCETVCAGRDTPVFSAKQLFVDRSTRCAYTLEKGVPGKGTPREVWVTDTRRVQQSLRKSLPACGPICRNQPFVLQVILPLVGS